MLGQNNYFSSACVIVLSILIYFYPFTTVHAVENLENMALPSVSACSYDDGDDPISDPENDECFAFQSNGDTFGLDNVLFALVSTEEWETYTCTLVNENDIIVPPPGNNNNCRSSSTTAQMVYENLEDGEYTFTITSTRQLDSNNVQLVNSEETGSTPPFIFEVNTGSGSSGGAGTGDETNDQPGTSFTVEGGSSSATNDNVAQRLNPIWKPCQADTSSTSNPPGSKSDTRSLSATQYTTTGNFDADEFFEELRDFDRDDFVLEINVNFLSGSLIADVYPTSKNVKNTESFDDTFKMDDNLTPAENSAKKRDKIPERIPFMIESVDTNCIYQAPNIATSMERGGANTLVSSQVYDNSNPPFAKCDGSESATYTMIFNIKERDTKGYDFSGIQDTKFVIKQQITGNNPEYTGSLIFDPYEKDQQIIDLEITGSNIVTQCTKALLY